MIETGERLKRTLFIMTKHSRRSFGVSPYSVSSYKTTFRQQLNGEKWGVELNLKQITITIYLINPSVKLKLSFGRTTKNISQ